jgi:hypothetical protein
MTASFHWEVWVHEASLAPSLFVEMSVPSMDCEWSCICVLGVSNFPLSTILIFVLELFSQWYSLFSIYYSLLFASALFALLYFRVTILHSVFGVF